MAPADFVAIKARELRLENLHRDISTANLLANNVNRGGARITFTLLDPGAVTDAFALEADGDTFAEVVDLLLHRLTHRALAEMKDLKIAKQEVCYGR